MSAVSARRLADKELIVVPYRRVSVSALATNVVLILLGCFFLLPLLWMVFASVDANPDWAIKIPTPTLANFADVLGRADALSSFRSSLILAGTTTVLTTLLALLAAYPLSRMHIPFRRSFMLVILFASGLPVSMLVVPVYQMYVYLGWLDSLYTTALFLAASSLPFAIWLMKNFIDAVPLVNLPAACRSAWSVSTWNIAWLRPRCLYMRLRSMARARSGSCARSSCR